MIDWIFFWSSKRPLVWEEMTKNMNMSTKHTIGPYNCPVNIVDVPNMYHDHEVAKHLKGSILDQFEAEEFKYVITRNPALFNKDDKLIIKKHLFPNLSLNETNSKTIGLDYLNDLLDTYGWIAIGQLFSNVELNANEGVARSVYYTRNPDTLEIINLSGHNQPMDHTYLPAITYVVFHKTKNKNCIVGVVNPNLVALPHVDDGILDETHRMGIVDFYDSSIERYLLTPIIKDATVVNDSIFVEDEFQIHQYRDSKYFHKYGDALRFPVKIETNFDYEIVGDIIRVKPTKQFGYIKLHYEVDAMINSYIKNSDGGIHTIEYKIFRG